MKSLSHQALMLVAVVRVTPIAWGSVGKISTYKDLGPVKLIAILSGSH